jgi:uncharacterized protein (TIGR02284 family)
MLGNKHHKPIKLKNMNRFDKSVEVMHDLLLIQYDRKAAYERIIKWPDHDEMILKYLNNIIRQSRNCILELREHIDVTCADPADRADAKGAIYHEWPGIRYFVPGNSASEIILFLEGNEHEVANAYQKALQPGNALCEAYRSVISDQYTFIRRSVEYINEYKEKPVETVFLSEEEKPFVFLHSRIFVESTFHNRAVDFLE